MKLENIITLEDLNSMLYLNPNFTDEYKINVGNLPSIPFDDTYYDFNIIRMSNEKGNINIKDSGYYLLNNELNGVVNFKIMLLSNLNSNKFYLDIVDSIGDTNSQKDFVSDLGLEIDYDLSQSTWYEITLIKINNLTHIYVFDTYKTTIEGGNYLQFHLNGSNLLEINIKDFKTSNNNTENVFTDNGKNIHWTYKGLKRKDGTYIRLSGQGNARPNFDDVYTKTKLYNNKNHHINFKYKNIKKELFNSNIENFKNTDYITTYNKLVIDGNNIKYTYDSNDGNVYNITSPNIILKDNFIITFKINSSINNIVGEDEELNLTEFAFHPSHTEQSQDNNEENIEGRKYAYNLEDYDLDKDYYFKIVRDNTDINIYVSESADVEPEFVDKIENIEENELVFNLNCYEVYEAEGTDEEKIVLNDKIGIIKFNLLNILQDNDIDLVLDGNPISNTGVIINLNDNDENEHELDIYTLSNLIYVFKDGQRLVTKYFDEDEYIYEYFLFYFKFNTESTLDFKNFNMNNLLDDIVTWSRQDCTVNEESLHHYVVEVYNKLWTGEIRFDRLTEEIILYTDSTLNYNNETYIFHILTTDDDFDIILRLDNNYVGERKYEEVKSKIKKIDNVWEDIYIQKFTPKCDKTKYEYPFYNIPNVTLTLKDMYGSPVSNAQVIVNNKYYSGSLITNSSGKVSFTPKSLKPGTYVCDIVIKKEGYYDEKLNIVLNPKKETPTIQFTAGDTYWGGYVTDTIKLNGHDNTKNVTVKVSCKDSVINSTVNTKFGSNRTITYEQSYRGKRLSSSNITVKTSATDYYNAVTKTFKKNHSLKYVDNWSQLKSEIENKKGVDVVGLKYNKTYTVGSNKIKYNRDMTIIGQNTSNGWATVTGASTYCFENNSPSKTKYITLKVYNVKFTKCNAVFRQTAYANLGVVNCFFHDNGKKNKSDMGICISTPISSTYQKKNYGKIVIKQCQFINNKGTNITTSINTNVTHCRFALTDWGHCQHPQAWALEVYGQTTNCDNTDFCLNTGSTRCPLPYLQHSNFSHGQAIIRINPNAVVNGHKGSNTNRYNVHLFNGKNCTAYLYTKYSYDGVNVTCSANRGYERSAYKNLVNGINWAWTNNCTVTTNNGNPSNPPKVTLPTSPVKNAKILKIGARVIW